MKCPNCGADIGNNSKKCKYCDSPVSASMVKEQVEMVKNQELLNKAKCARCGSTNLSFSREKQKIVKGKKGTTAIINTVGLCKDCGYTWNVNGTKGEKSKSKAPIWVWVIGWLLLFPLPLTIILWRNEKVNKNVKYAVIAIAWLAYLLIAISGGSADSNTDTISNTPQDTTNEITNSITDDRSVTLDIDVIYELNEDINLFVNNYNRANPNEKITKDMCKPYYHHGRNHDDQIHYYANGFEIVITGGSYSGGINFFIGYTKGTDHTNDDYKEMFRKYIKGFDLGIDDDQIDADWDTIMKDLTHNVRFDSYEADINKPNDKIEYMKITKK